MIRQQPGDIVLILAGDHIYKMDYQPFIQFHRRNRADVTVAVKRVPLGEAHRFGILALDDDGQRDRVAGEAQAAQERPGVAGHLRLLEEGAARLAGRLADRLWAGRHPGHARRRRARVRLPVRRLLAGRRHGRGLLAGAHGPARGASRRSTCTTRTGSSTRAPRSARRRASGPTANVHRSLISHGCQIWGTVERSVLSPGVRVDPGAVVRDSIIMFDTVIRAGAVVDRAIIDKEVSIGPNAIVGFGRRLRHRQPPGADAAQHRHHRRRQARRHPGRRAPRPQRQDQRGRASGRLRRQSACSPPGRRIEVHRPPAGAASGRAAPPSARRRRAAVRAHDRGRKGRALGLPRGRSDRVDCQVRSLTDLGLASPTCDRARGRPCGAAGRTASTCPIGLFSARHSRIALR